MADPTSLAYTPYDTSIPSVGIQNVSPQSYSPAPASSGSSIGSSLLGAAGSLLGSNPFSAILSGGLSAITSWYGMKKQEEQAEKAREAAASQHNQDIAVNAKENQANRDWQSSEKNIDRQMAQAEADRTWKWNEEQDAYKKADAARNNMLSIIGSNASLQQNLRNIWGGK